jgi:hypothetical protein
VRACVLGAGGGCRNNAVGDEVKARLGAEWGHLGQWREVDGSYVGLAV